MPSDNTFTKHLRTLGHGLKPVVIVAGKGLTESVLNELNRALEDHELVKIKIALTDRDLRKEIAKEICLTLHAELIQEIGKVALLYREARKPKIKTSNIR